MAWRNGNGRSRQAWHSSAQAAWGMAHPGQATSSGRTVTSQSPQNTSVSAMPTRQAAQRSGHRRRTRKEPAALSM
jgi:hypothetical protein